MNQSAGSYESSFHTKPFLCERRRSQGYNPQARLDDDRRVTFVIQTSDHDGIDRVSGPLLA